MLLAILAGCKQGEKAEEEQATITAEQMIDANFDNPHILARSVARKVITLSEKDTAGIRSVLAEADTIKARYISAGRKADAEAFDTTFRNTVATVRGLQIEKEQ